MVTSGGLGIIVNALLESPSEEGHNALLQALAESPLGGQPKRDLFLAYRYLQQIILFFESLDGSNDGARQIDESKYGDEVGWLQKIAAATQYSPAIYQWAGGHLPSMAKEIREASFERLDRWPEMTIGEKEEILEDVAARQAEIYSKGAIPFSAPRLEILPSDSPIEGAVALSRAHTAAGEVPIQLNRALLEAPTPRPALLRLHHETIHHLTVQLAFAVRDGKIADNHPLYEDACLRLARFEAGGAATIRLNSVYGGDGEENLAYEQEMQFLFALSGQKPPEPVKPQAGPLIPPAPP